MTIVLIICTYNNASLLRGTLESLELQIVPQHLQWQVLVVDNNCTDETNTTVEDFIQRNKIPLKSIREIKQGLTYARHCGVRNTKSEWLAFIDDDCILAPDWLAQTMNFALAHPYCGGFGGRIQLFFENEPPEYVFQFPYAYAGKNHGENAFKRKSLAGLGMTLRRKALESTSWIDKPLLDDRIGNKLISGGDMEIGLRVSAHHEIWYNPNCCITHIIPERRTTRQYLRKMLFGLGASRHNVVALTWEKGYFLFVLFTFLLFIGIIIKGIYDGLKELFSGKKRAGFRVFLSSAWGWIWAMFYLFRMDSAQRRAIIGGVY